MTIWRSEGDCDAFNFAFTLRCAHTDRDLDWSLQPLLKSCGSSVLWDKVRGVDRRKREQLYAYELGDYCAVVGRRVSADLAL